MGPGRWGARERITRSCTARAAAAFFYGGAFFENAGLHFEAVKSGKAPAGLALDAKKKNPAKDAVLQFLLKIICFNVLVSFIMFKP
jgi:hypothetical protein